MNKKGLTFFYTFMLGILIIVLGIYSFTPMKNVLDEARGNVGSVGCTTPDNDWDTALCWMLDIFKFAVPAFIVLIGFTILTAKRYIIGS